MRAKDPVNDALHMQIVCVIHANYLASISRLSNPFLIGEEERRALDIEIRHLKRKYDDDWMKYYRYHLDLDYDDDEGNPYDYGMGDEHDEDDDDNWWRR